MRLLDQLDEKILSLAAKMNVVTHELLVAIREFDECSGFASQGYKTCAQYLTFRIGMASSTAREHVRVAHALATLPKIAAEMASGALSYSKARELTRIATAETEDDFLAAAHEVSAATLTKLVNGYRRVDDRDKAERREERRYVSHYTDDDGMIVIQARVLAEEGATIIKALETMPIERGEHRVDALVKLAERALGHEPACAAADRHQVVIHVDADVLAKRDGHAEIGSTGTSPEVVRRLCCDASVIAMTHDKDGNVVDAGRKTRTLSTPLRRKLKERDGDRCVFPGCDNRYTDAHHVQHWADGGATTLENLASLCRLCRARHKRHYAACRIMPRRPANPDAIREFGDMNAA